MKHGKVVNFIVAYEQGELSDEEIITGFQDLIDCSLVWKLQGNYGRLAAQLIDEGYCHRRHPPATCLDPSALIPPGLQP